jgi:hypothetical protein
MCGLPYANPTDPELMEKMQYLDSLQPPSAQHSNASDVGESLISCEHSLGVCVIDDCSVCELRIVPYKWTVAAWRLEQGLESNSSFLPTADAARVLASSASRFSASITSAGETALAPRLSVCQRGRGGVEKPEIAPTPSA